MRNYTTDLIWKQKDRRKENIHDELQFGAYE
jgi:hypothetical protein